MDSDQESNTSGSLIDERNEFYDESGSRDAPVQSDWVQRLLSAQ
jgi:hypothetical protein